MLFAALELPSIPPVEGQCYSILCPIWSLFSPYLMQKHNFLALVGFIPDICHEPHEHVRVNFFWPV